MKILEINKFFFPQGGGDKHFLDLIELLENHGHEVAVFSMADPNNRMSPWSRHFVSYVGYLSKDNLWQRFKGLLRIYSFESQRKIKKLLEEFRPEVVHIHNIYHQISPSILPIIKKQGIPIVMTVHDYSLICPNYNFAFQGTDWDRLPAPKFFNFVLKKGFKNSYWQSFLAALEYQFLKITRIYDKNVDLFIAPSLFLKEKLVAGGIREDKIVVLPHFGNSRIENVPEESDYIFHFGRLSKSKGAQDIIDIFKKLPQELRLAGKMEEPLNLENAPNIKYLGALNQNELRKQIRKSMFVVAASRLPETFGLIALETLENGRPFVSLGSGAYGEIIRNEEEGYLCQDLEELKERIGALAKNKNLRQEMSRKALQKAREFSSERYQKKLLEIFDFLAKKC